MSFVKRFVCWFGLVGDVVVRGVKHDRECQRWTRGQWVALPLELAPGRDKSVRDGWCCHD